MVQPLDFTFKGVQDPLESVRRGLEFGQAQALRPELLERDRAAFERQGVEQQQADTRFGQGNVLFEQGQQDRQAALAAAEQDRQNALQMRADLEALTDNPSAAAYARLSTQYPEIAGELTQAWNLLDKSEQDSNLRFMGGLYSSIQSSIASGNDERTVTMLEDRIEALNNTTGREEEAQQTQAYLETFRADPESARTAVGVGLSVLGQGQFDQVLGDEKTPQELAIEEAKLHLAQAQITKVVAETRAEIRKLSPGGLITDPKEVAEQEDKMRKELEQRNAVFNDTRDAFSRVNASSDTAAGDLALIFNFMKMLDPGSVVRESEFATAENAASVPERFRASFDKLLEGTRLDPAARKRFVDEAEGMMAAAQLRRSENIAGFEGIIDRRGLTRENVIFEEVATDGGQPAPDALTPDQEFDAFFGGAP